jgi:hypothetical protein
MRFFTKNAVATYLVDLTIFVYVGYLAIGRLPIIDDVRDITALGLVLGVASRVIGGPIRLSHQWPAVVGGVASIALGVGALATQHQSFLALFMASIIGLWIAGEYVRTSDRSDNTERSQLRPQELSRHHRLPDGHGVTTPHT